MSIGLAVLLLQLQSPVLTPQQRLKQHVASTAPFVAAIRKKWAEEKPRFEGSPYEEEPSGHAPFAPGRLKRAFLQDGLNMLNFARFVAGLPADVAIDESKLLNAQWGAVVNLANHRLSHRPDQPSNMPREEFERGLAATSSSNIAAGYPTLASAVLGYLDDGSSGDPGHRRWCLNYGMQTTAFGFAGEFSNMASFDTSRSHSTSWDYVAWPAEDACPLRFVRPGFMWSVSLNPKVYRQPDAATLVVEVTRLNDGYSWRLEPANGPQRLAIHPPGYGDQWCITFCPKDTLVIHAGDVYEVEIQGIQYLNGAARKLLYRTQFFDL